MREMRVELTFTHKPLNEGMLPDEAATEFTELMDYVLDRLPDYMGELMKGFPEISHTVTVKIDNGS